jgi:tripartite-type tricarboxylate transporter receptor subunit TctC
MTGTLSQSVAVENRVGAGGTAGSEYAAHAEQDGYTLIAGTQSTDAINVSIATGAFRRAVSRRSAASARHPMWRLSRPRSRSPQ